MANHHEQPLPLEWNQVKRKMQGVTAPFERQPPEQPVRPHGFQLRAGERDALAKLMVLPPATRSFNEVKQLLRLLRGADLMLQLDEDQQATVANAMRWEEYAKGAMIATEMNASDDSFLLLVAGTLTVLVRDTSVRTSRAPLRQLQPGECFAEGSLLEHTKMAPSLVAGDSATVLRVGSADFMAAHASWQMELLERKVAALRSALCLASFDERSLRPIAERLALERRHADAVIVAQGAEASRIYCLGAGECRVLLRTAAGPMLHVATLGPGAIFGEVGVLFDVPHTASVVSASDVTLFALTKTDLFVGVGPEFSRFIEVLRVQARSYPDEAALLSQMQLTDHWREYKRMLLHANRHEHAAAKGNLPFGPRPVLPEPPPVAAARAGPVPSERQREDKKRLKKKLSKKHFVPGPGTYDPKHKREVGSTSRDLTGSTVFRSRTQRRFDPVKLYGHDGDPGAYEPTVYLSLVMTAKKTFSQAIQDGKVGFNATAERILSFRRGNWNEGEKTPGPAAYKPQVTETG
eukprot:jgi/Chrpa1/18520/Chrysochromulina_OHIO_Genome00023895-RA